MKIDLLEPNLTNYERKEIGRLLNEINKKGKIFESDLECMWYLLDLVWNEYGCDNKNLDWAKINKFYSHPVWVLNTLFIEQDNISMMHRHRISEWILRNNIRTVIDYGGGGATLAILIAKENTNINIDIYEPYPSEFALKRVKEFKNVKFVNLITRKYDCLVSIDVLEHVVDPLSVFKEMIDSVKINGYLIVANCFYPVIKCHLPQTFHFRYTFNIFAKMMGLKIIGKLEGSHAVIFKKEKEANVDWKKIRIYEKISKTLFPFIEFAAPILKPMKRLIFK